MNENKSPIWRGLSQGGKNTPKCLAKSHSDGQMRAPSTALFQEFQGKIENKSHQLGNQVAEFQQEEPELG